MMSFVPLQADVNATAVLTIIAIATIIVLALGYFAYTRTGRGPVEYFVAGRTIGLVFLVFTFAATNYSAFFIFGSPGFFYLHGMPQSASLVWGAFLGVSIFLFGRRLSVLGRVKDYITPADYVADFYDSEFVRAVVGLMTIVYVLPWLIAQVIGLGLAFEASTGGVIPYWAGALLFVVIAMIYVGLGGMRAVVWTDFIQGLFFFIMAWAVGLWLTYTIAGGIGPLMAQVAETAPGKLVNPGGVGVYALSSLWFSLIFMFGLLTFVFPPLWQRAYIARDTRSLTVAAALVPILTALGHAPNWLIGYVGIVDMGGFQGSPDAILPALLAKHAPLLGGVVVAVGLAAARSTTDSVLLTISSSVVEDLYLPFINEDATEDQQQLYGRIVVLLVGAAMFFIALAQPGFIVMLTSIAWSGFMPLAVIVIGSFWWKRPTKEAAIATLVVGNAAFLYMWGTGLSFWPNPASGLHMGPMVFIISAVTYIVVSLVTSLDRDNVEEFWDIWERTGFVGPLL